MSDPDAKLGEERATVAVDDGELLRAAQTKTKLELAQEQRQWNEDRTRRRLMNEYERAGKALGEVVSQSVLLSGRAPQAHNVAWPHPTGLEQPGRPAAPELDPHHWHKTHAPWLPRPHRFALPFQPDRLGHVPGSRRSSIPRNPTRRAEKD